MYSFHAILVFFKNKHTVNQKYSILLHSQMNSALRSLSVPLWKYQNNTELSATNKQQVICKRKTLKDKITKLRSSNV